MIDRPRTFLLDENIPRKVLSTLRRAGFLRFFPRNASVTDIASAVLKAVGQLAELGISNSVYTLAPEGLEKET